MENEKETNHKDHAKEKIILFTIGVLVGAVISTGAFFAYISLAGIGNSNNQSMQMPGGTPPEKPSGDNEQSGTPPEMPSDRNESNDENETSSEKPSNTNSTSSDNEKNS